MNLKEYAESFAFTHCPVSTSIFSKDAVMLYTNRATEVLTGPIDNLGSIKPEEWPAYFGPLEDENGEELELKNYPVIRARDGHEVIAERFISNWPKGPYRKLLIEMTCMLYHPKAGEAYIISFIKKIRSL